MLTVARYRETRSVGMVVLEDEQGRATRLAEVVGEALGASASTSAKHGGGSRT